MKKIILSSCIVIAFLFFLSGCGPSYVVVRSKPEAPVYTRPVAPGPGFVWIEGEWVRSGHGYVYKQGYWARPRARYREYAGGHWQEGRGGWYWVRGHWN